MHTSKLVVVGVGHVGSYVLSYAMDSGLYSEIATIDIKPGVSKGEAIDQAQSTGVPGTAYTYCHPGDYSDCADADVIIVAAGARSFRTQTIRSACPTGQNSRRSAVR